MENSNIKGHWIGIFTSKGNKTQIDFIECVTAKKNNFETFCKIIFKKTTNTIYCGFEESIRKVIVVWKGEYTWRNMNMMIR